MNGMFADPARASASMVLPVPGGPKSRMLALTSDHASLPDVQRHWLMAHYGLRFNANGRTILPIT